jgi:hypothetical protein
MQVANEIACRRIYDEYNFFEGTHQSWAEELGNC